MNTRTVIISTLLSLSGLVHSANTELTLTVDTTGNATICFPKDSSWRVNVEQFRWNKWVFVKHVEFERILEKDTCVSFTVDLHSGTNQFRVNKFHGSRAYASCCRVTVETNKLTPDHNEQYGSFGQGDTIKLPYLTMWEIYDAYGNLQWKGMSKEIAVRGLQEGDYYLCYDNMISIVAVYHEEHRVRKE